MLHEIIRWEKHIILSWASVNLPLRYHAQFILTTTRFNSGKGDGPAMNGYKNQGTVDDQILLRRASELLWVKYRKVL